MQIIFGNGGLNEQQVCSASARGAENTGIACWWLGISAREPRKSACSGGEWISYSLYQTLTNNQLLQLLQGNSYGRLNAKQFKWEIGEDLKRWRPECWRSKPFVPNARAELETWTVRECKYENTYTNMTCNGQVDCVSFTKTVKDSSLRSIGRFDGKWQLTVGELITTYDLMGTYVVLCHSNF